MSIYEPLEQREGRRVLQLRSPITLEPSGTLVCANQQDVAAAVELARKAQPAWAALTFEQRAQYMHRALQLWMDRADDIVERVVAETGKARADAFSMEVWSCCDSLCYYAKNAQKFLRPQNKRVHGILGITKKVKINYKPLGVAGIIVPWNGPVVLGLNPAVQALMAGNTVLIKASEVTPYSTKIIEEIFTAAGLPAGVLQVLLGDGDTGAFLCEAGVDKIAFTGSVNTGRKVAESCARQLIPCTLELGGKDAMIVCDDADLDRAAAGAVIGSCMNTGHYCCGTERIYVLDSVYDEFVAKVVALVKTLRQGSDLGYEEDVGAVFWDRQMTIIEDHVADALDKGAQILVGGQRNPDLPGLYFQPTVMTHVDHGMKIMTDETFGPIVCLQRVKDEAEALRLANDSRYGLNGNVWSKNTRHAVELAGQVETGGISVNDMALGYGIPVAPFGGVKESGVGRVNGEVGIRGYCHAVPIIIERFGGKNLPSGYPHSAKKIEGMKKFMRFLWGTPLGRWLS
jgi:succinate-semialdehyde dehydrogenase/glutarate-semialdehyde dehydrogenase